MKKYNNIVESETAPNKDQLWLHNGVIKKFGANGWEATSAKVNPDNLVGKKTAEGGEVFNDTENNIAGLNAHAENYSGKSRKYENCIISISENIVTVKGYEYDVGRCMKVNNEIYSIINVKVKYPNAELTLNKPCLFDKNAIFYIVSGAIGEGSHAEGRRTNAAGNYSHAEGSASSALGEYSHSEGSGPVAFSREAHAEGFATRAYGESSHAEGSNTLTQNESEHAEGQYNISNTNETNNALTTQSSIGIGQEYNKNYNAQEVMKNGDFYVYGIGNYQGKLLDTVDDDGKGTGNKLPNVKSLQEVITNLENRIKALEGAKA